MVYAALKVILVNRLQKSLHPSEKIGHLGQDGDWSDRANEAFASHFLELGEIPINRVQRHDRICYVSAVALKLSQQRVGPSLELAHHIAEGLRLQESPPSTPLLSNGAGLPFWREVERQVGNNFTVEVKPPGWIYLHLTDRGLAAWLQGLVEFTDWNTWLPTTPSPGRSSTSTPPVSTLPKSIDTFQILHSHARCCALLRLGVRENLIQLHESDRNRCWQLTYPHPIPWLPEEQPFPGQQAPEQRLIAQIIEVIDRLSEPEIAIPKRWRLAQELSQVFYQFHVNCQIVGGVKESNLSLVQARLGLVLICQKLLQHLLQYLQVMAPTEL